MLHGATALKKAANKLIKVFLEIVKLRKYIARISIAPARAAGSLVENSLSPKNFTDKIAR